MNWFYLALLSVTALAAAELTQQHILTKENPFHERASGVLTFFAQSMLALALVFILGKQDQLFSVFSPAILPWTLLVTFLASFGMVFYLKSFKVKNISFSSIFVSGSIVVSTTLGIIIFQESISLAKFSGILLVAIAILSTNWKNTLIEKNHLYGLLAALFFGFTYTLDKKIISSGIDPIIYIVWAFLLVSAFGTLANPRLMYQNIRTHDLISYKPIFLSGLGYFAYNIFTFYV